MAMTQTQYNHLEQHLHGALKRNEMGYYSLFRDKKPCCLLGWGMDAMGVSSYEGLEGVEKSQDIDNDYPGAAVTPEQRVKVLESIFHLDPIPKERIGTFITDIEEVMDGNDYGDQGKTIELFLAIPEMQPS